MLSLLNSSKSSGFALSSGFSRLMIRQRKYFWLPGRALRHLIFLGGLPAVLNERLLGERTFVHGQAEDVLFFLEFNGKSLDVHALFPKSGNYLARQSGAPRYPKLKLF